MKYTADQYAEALLLAIEESHPDEADLVIENLTALLKTSGDLDIFPQVVEIFERLHEARKGIKDVEVTFAKNIESNKELLHKLNEMAGPELEIRSNTDDQLVGGLVLRAGDTLVDGSVSGQLERMRTELKDK